MNVPFEDPLNHWGKLALSYGTPKSLGEPCGNLDYVLRDP